MLQVVISPAKQMQVRADAFAPRGLPPFPAKTSRIVRKLRLIERERGVAGLKALWGVNDKLLAENIERLHGFECVMDEAQLDDPLVARLLTPAIFSYVGIQYRSMAPEVLDLDALDWLQAHLWVLSALYGCVRPFDAVQPYRLEMAAKLELDGERGLYAYWGDDIARAVCAGDADGDGGPVAVVNLASVEYSKAVVPHVPEGVPVITCIFGEELRRGKPVQRATASKIARGSMVRWMAENAACELDDLKRFDIGYAYAPELSSERGDERTLVFMKR